jgi:nicotinamide-nucleotide amidase
MAAADARAPDDAALAALAADLGHALAARGLRLALAESCTGGWIAKAVTDNPGASEWFAAGFVTYSDAAKAAALGVASELIATHGAVSELVVEAMAVGARQKTGADAAIAVSGVAGPGGGSPSKPVGLVWFGWSLGDRNWTGQADFQGDRDAVRRQAVGRAMSVLRNALDRTSA